MDSLITRITEWAATRDDIRSAVLVGSRARSERPADEWSDADISLFVTDVDVYLWSGDWLNEIGRVHITFTEKTGIGGQMERRAMFEGAQDVDFSILPDGMMKMLAMMLQANNVPPEVQAQVEELRGVLRRGVRILLDKDDTMTQIAAGLIPGEKPQAVPPTEKEFVNLVNNFWYHTIWTTKKLRRGELWTAKSCLDGFIKWECVLPLIQWHTKAKNGWNTDTWHGGRFVEKWAAPRIIEGLYGSFAHYDAADIGRALLAQMATFRALAIETAKLLGYPYPYDADMYCTRWVENQLKVKAQGG